MHNFHQKAAPSNYRKLITRVSPCETTAIGEKLHFLISANTNLMIMDAKHAAYYRLLQLISISPSVFKWSAVIRCFSNFDKMQVLHKLSPQWTKIIYVNSTN